MMKDRNMKEAQRSICGAALKKKSACFMTGGFFYAML